MKEQIRDNSERSKDITMVFYAFIVINIIAILLVIFQSYILKDYNGAPADISKIELLDLFIPIVRYAQVGIHIVAIIFFLRWFKRAYGNLIRRYQPMEYSENGAVWGFFIPIVNFYRPITTAKEIYLKTQYSIKEYNSNLRIDTDTSFISLWWIVVIVNRFFASYTNNRYRDALDINSFIEANGYAIISDVINIISIVLVLYVIHKITKVETLLKDTNESVSEIDEIGKALE